MIPKDNPLKGMASEIEAPLQAANSTGLYNISHPSEEEISRIPESVVIPEYSGTNENTTNSVIIDQAPEAPSSESKETGFTKYSGIR